ncbi:hypothetical protein MGYG_07100 [Nannizzia gypsea CBS 118893]|uniref:Rhamnogalacturonase A/B/Epimerase-like pectate lyase domain-containing protein n=1 Tax=Arthroderma gypseum (strain ATCC MYA-4604 / CBS 118893) TaxID=535722 RepID=E4V228_ARTGP|nr:hypothetical protein MGYG_07100 [Nannizzia gypsea CBS 118893]EFR04093.1 hypothetical protein MGYG_07100 [Nannizzia gypsea CBS 118893]
MARGLVSSLLLGQLLLVLVGLFSPAGAAPTPQSQTPNTQASSYWLSSIKRQGIAPFNGGGAGYKVFRNVKDFGAKGDGSSDDTAAINMAISSGSRCGKGCDSSTTTPAIVYFPPGTYVVSKPIIQYYYTQIVGDALNMPVIKAAASFEGIAVIDADPYENDGSNWYTNQNNFFRSIRNVAIDLTGLDRGKGACIHWQVAQASSLQNIRFEMVKGGGDANKQIGIFMDNGSGGFMTDLVFNGGNFVKILRHPAVHHPQPDLQQLQHCHLHELELGLDLQVSHRQRLRRGFEHVQRGFNQTVGSVMILDSKIKNTPKGIVTSFNANSVPESGGTLILDNVDFTGSADAVSSLQGSSIVPGNTVVKHWIQGNSWTPGSSSKAKRLPPQVQAQPEVVRRDECPAPAPQPPAPSTVPPYPIPETSAPGVPTRVPTTEPSNVPTRTPTGGVPSGTTGSTPSTPSPSAPPTGGPTACPTAAVTKARVQSALPQPSKPAILLDKNGKVFERAKPQYENVPASQFISVKSAGAKGDGKTDDTKAIQAVLDKATADQVVYFDHGAYLITSTIKVPKNIKITGEIWPMLMATGKAFSDMKNPIPMLQVGQPGDKGTVELSELIVTTKGPAPGCILVEWNVAEETQGSVGMWDVHFRVGGFAGTELQSNTCAKTPNSTTTPNPKCFGAFMLLHITKTASAYLENTWLWVSDHELDLSDHGQINIYNGRGALIESSGAVWMYGTASEHNTLYNYQIQNAKNVYMALIQTETPYYQSNPDALVPFAPDSKYNDPTFGDCTTAACKKAWGLRILNSSDVFLFGGGLYSFFENYNQDCLKTESCQLNMIEVLCSETYLYGVSTKASTNMITSGGKGLVPQKENRSNFCSTIALFHQGKL